LTELVEVLGSLLAWLATSLLVLSESRGGLAVGLGGAGLGLGIALAASGNPAAGVAVGAGGVAAALLRLRDGQAGWGILPQGSTPRVILCVVAGAACAWVGGSLLAGAPGALRSGTLAVLVLAVARLLTTGRRQAALAAASALALATGLLGGLAAPEAALGLVGAGAVAALLLGVVPAAEGAGRGA
jgi:hypothetical protein